MKKIFALLTILTLTVVSCKNETKTEPTTDVFIDSTNIESTNVELIDIDTTKVVEEVK
jgi:hypothetical protein